MKLYNKRIKLQIHKKTPALLPYLIALLGIISVHSTAAQDVDVIIDKTVETVEVLDDELGEYATKNREVDTSYIRHYDGLGIYIYQSLSFHSFKIIDLTQNSSLKYASTINQPIGIGFSRYGYAGSISRDINIIQQSKSTYGQTKKTNLSASFSYRKVGVSAFFFRYKKFYIKNPEDFDVNWNTEGKPQRTDIENMGYGLNYLYVFNHKKFSLNAAYSFSQKQLKSVGSFITGIHTAKYMSKGDSSLINTSISNSFNPHLHFQKSTQYVLGSSFGYSYNYVFWKNFMINASILPSVLLSISNLSYPYPNNYSDQNFNISPSLKMNGMISYSKNKYHFSLFFSKQNYWLKSGSSVRINYDFMDLKLLVAYRFEKKKK